MLQAALQVVVNKKKFFLLKVRQNSDFIISFSEIQPH